MTDRGPIEQLQELWGGSVHDTSGQEHRDESWKTAYVWELHCRMAREFMLTIAVFLHDRRRRQFAEALKERGPLMSPSEKGSMAHFTDGWWDGGPVDDEKVRRVRVAYAQTDLTQHEIAEVFNISENAVGHWIRGDNRKAAPGPIKGEDY